MAAEQIARNTRVSSALRWIWLAALSGVLIFAFLTGVDAWRSSPSKGWFYQTEYAPALMFACGEGLHNISGNRPEKISAFLQLGGAPISCQEAVPLPAGAGLTDINIFHKMTIGSQYLFGWLWWFEGPNWDAAAYVTGFMKAGMVLSTFLLLLVFLPAPLALIVSVPIAFTDTAAASELLNLRDFSKVAFTGALLYLGVRLYDVSGDRLPWLGALAAFVLAFALGFRQDLSLFLFVLPLILGARLLVGRDRRRTAVALVLFGLTLIAFKFFIFDFTQGLSANIYHIYFLGQGEYFLQAQNVQIGDYALGSFYNDSYLTFVINAYGALLGLPPAALGTELYNEMGRAALLTTTSQFPADTLARGLAAMFTSLFGGFAPYPLTVNLTPLQQMATGTGVFVVLLYYARERALALLLPVVLVAALAFVQFHARHVFAIGLIGKGLLAAAVILVAMDLATRFFPHAALDRLRSAFRLPRSGRRETGSRLAFAVLPILAILILPAAIYGLRHWQAHSFEAIVAELEGAPRQPVALRYVRQPVGDFPLYLDMAGWRGGVSFVRLAFAGQGDGCPISPKLGFVYDAENAYYRWNQAAPLRPGPTTAVYLPVVDDRSGARGVINNTLMGITMDEATAACLRSADLVPVPKGIFPGVYKVDAERAQPFYRLAAEEQLRALLAGIRG